MTTFSSFALTEQLSCRTASSAFAAHALACLCTRTSRIMLTLAVCTLSPPLVTEKQGEAEQRASGKDDEREDPGATRTEVLFPRQHRGCQGDAHTERCDDAPHAPHPTHREIKTQASLHEVGTAASFTTPPLRGPRPLNARLRASIKGSLESHDVNGAIFERTLERAGFGQKSAVRQSEPSDAELGSGLSPCPQIRGRPRLRDYRGLKSSLDL